MSDFILVLAILTTESSYKSEIEHPATDVADTIQYWFGSKPSRRIRTYAIDHDIHIYSLSNRDDGSAFTPSEAEIHINKHYSDVIKKLYIIKFKDPNNTAEVAKVLKSYNLEGILEVASAGFAFYNPDRAKYKTQSQPK